MANTKGLTDEERKTLSWNYLILRGFWRAKDTKNIYKDLYERLGVKQLGGKYAIGEQAGHRFHGKLEIVDPKFIQCLIGKAKIVEKEDLYEILGKGTVNSLWNTVEDGIFGKASTKDGESKEDRDKRRKAERDKDIESFESHMKKVYDTLEQGIKQDMPFDDNKVSVLERVIFWIKFGYEISSNGDRRLVELLNTFQTTLVNDYLQCKNTVLLKRLYEASEQNMKNIVTVYNIRLLEEKAVKERP